jgi:hypothetical protein
VIRVILGISQPSSAALVGFWVRRRRKRSRSRDGRGGDDVELQGGRSGNHPPRQLRLRGAGKATISQSLWIARPPTCPSTYNLEQNAEIFLGVGKNRSSTRRSGREASGWKTAPPSATSPSSRYSFFFLAFACPQYGTVHGTAG